LNPKYEKDENMLRYDFTFLGNVTFPDLPAKFAKSVLVIDSTGIEEIPLQYSGD
jgi:hypothetical protein